MLVNELVSSNCTHHTLMITAHPFAGWLFFFLLFRDFTFRRTAADAALAAKHPAIARVINEFACATGRDDWAAGNLRLLFDNAAPKVIAKKWHFL